MNDASEITLYLFLFTMITFTIIVAVVIMGFIDLLIQDACRTALAGDYEQVTYNWEFNTRINQIEISTIVCHGQTTSISF